MKRHLLLLLVTACTSHHASPLAPDATAPPPPSGDLPPEQLDPFYRAGKQQVCMIGADGTNRRTLTHCTMCGSDNPGWSPDGQQVFFDRGTYTAGVVTNVVDVDGTNEHELLDASYGGGRLPWFAGGGA